MAWGVCLMTVNWFTVSLFSFRSVPPPSGGVVCPVFLHLWKKIDNGVIHCVELQYSVGTLPLR